MYLIHSQVFQIFIQLHHALPPFACFVVFFLPAFCFAQSLRTFGFVAKAGNYLPPKTLSDSHTNAQMGAGSSIMAGVYIQKMLYHGRWGFAAEAVYALSDYDIAMRQSNQLISVRRFTQQHLLVPLRVQIGREAARFSFSAGFVPSFALTSVRRITYVTPPTWPVLECAVGLEDVPSGNRLELLYTGGCYYRLSHDLQIGLEWMGSFLAHDPYLDLWEISDKPTRTIPAFYRKSANISLRKRIQ